MRADFDFQLRPLAGWTLTAYRLAMALLVLIALPGFFQAYGQQAEAQEAVQPGYAAGLRFPGGNARVTRVAPFSAEAHDKGVLPGDKLIAIDGKALPAFDFEMIQALLSGPDGSRYRLTIQTRDAPARTVTLTRDSRSIDRAYAGSGLSFAGRSWTVFGFAMLDSVLALATALLLFVRRQTDPVAAMLALCAVPAAQGMIVLWPDGGFALDAFSIARQMIFLIAILLYPNGRFAPAWAVWLVPLVPLIEIVAVQATTREAAIGLRQMLFFAFVIGAVATFIVRYRSTPPGAERQQIKFVMLGGAGWAGFGLVGLILQRLSDISISVPAAAWYSLGAHLAGSLGAMALETGILLSLLRLRLYDADVLISRSAAYTVLTLLLGPAFAASDKVLQVFGQQFFGEGGRALSAGFGAAIAATLIAPLNKRVRQWTEHRFQRQLAALRQDLPQLIGDLREYAALTVLIESALRQIRHGIRAGRVALILHGGDGDRVWSEGIEAATVQDWKGSQRLDRAVLIQIDREEALFPVRVALRQEGAGAIGWILIGRRPDGSLYSKEERKALAEIADPIARGIRITEERQRRIAENRARNEMLERRIAELEGALRRLHPDVNRARNVQSEAK